jgi:uridylate kinase
MLQLATTNYKRLFFQNKTEKRMFFMYLSVDFEIRNMKLVIKIGGSVIFDEYGVKTDYVKRLLPVLTRINKENQLILAIGGGKFVKNYENRAMKFFEKKIVQESSIHILRANIVFFGNLLGTKPIFSLKDVKKNTRGVIGGVMPGRSTDANAAAAAAVIKSDLFIKITDVDGIYDKDPHLYGDAKIFKEIKFAALQRILKKEDKNDYAMLDETAQSIIVKNRIKTIIAGSEPSNILKIISGEKIGTVIN